MARVKTTVRKVSVSNDSLCSHSDRITKSGSSGTKKKKLTVKLHALALQPAQDPAMPSTGAHSQPERSDAASPSATMEDQITTDSTRSRRRRRLITNDPDSDGSQDGPPSRTSSHNTPPPTPGAPALPQPPSAPQPATSATAEAVTTFPSLLGTSTQPPPTTFHEAQPTHFGHATATPGSSIPISGPTPAQATISQVQSVHFPAFTHHLWLTFSVHESLNIQNGLPEYASYGSAQLDTSRMLESEVQEYHTCRHSFPHVPQQLYPASRPDGLVGQFYHLTQIPTGTAVDTQTGLSHTHQIVIRFDTGYHEMTKPVVQAAALARFESMGIPLANRFREPVSALVHPHTKTWLGFLKVDLLNPSTDGIALLKGERIFTLQLQDLSYVIGKVEKGFDFPSTAANRRLTIQSPGLSRFTSRQLQGELTRLGYIGGTNLEFIGVTKRTKELETAEITVASEHSKQYLLSTPVLFDGQRLTVTTSSSDRSSNPNAPDALSTSILVRGLPVEYSQIQISAALHKLLGPSNVLAVTYNRAEGDSLGRHDGVATLRCLNAAVYTHWCNRRGIPCLGKYIDFAPHARSLAGTNPAAATRSHDQRPTREVIAEAITAYKNESPLLPTLTDMETSMQAVEGRLRTHITNIGGEINSHTTVKVDTATAQHHALQQSQHSLLLHQLQLLTSASRDYSNQMSGIFSGLNPGPPEGLLPPPDLPHNNPPHE